MTSEARRRVVGDDPSSITRPLAAAKSATSSREQDENGGMSMNDVNIEATQLEQIQSRYTLASAVTQTQLQPPDPSAPNKFVHFIEAKIIFPVKKFWNHQVSITVDHDTCRDHLALERTFLGYLRTSLVFSTLGIVVAQLFRLQHVAKPDSVFGYFVLAKPLAVICQCVAIYALLLGAFRSWRHQNAIVRGKAITGGFEVILLAFGTLVVSNLVTTI